MLFLHNRYGVRNGAKWKTRRRLPGISSGLKLLNHRKQNHFFFLQVLFDPAAKLPEYLRQRGRFTGPSIVTRGGGYGKQKIYGREFLA